MATVSCDVIIHLYVVSLVSTDTLLVPVKRLFKYVAKYTKIKIKIYK
jgi:hypothetical protein